MKKFTQPLPCILTPEELEATAKELAEQVVLKNEIEEKKKSVSQSYKESIDDLKIKIEQLSETIIRRTKEKNIQCHEEYNPISKRMDCYRDDTGKVITSRDLTVEELQKEFAFAEALAIKEDVPEVVEG